MRIKDGDWELIDWDAATGRTVWRTFDGQMTHYRTDMPVHSIIEQNKQMNNAAAPGFAGDYHKVASVPLNVAWDSGLVQAFKESDDKYIAKYLNDSDNRAWRTKEGNL